MGITGGKSGKVNGAQIMEDLSSKEKILNFYNIIFDICIFIFKKHFTFIIYFPYNIPARQIFT